MKVLGFRADSKNPRYAVLQNGSDNSILFLNQTAGKDVENRLCFPLGMDAEEDKLKWLYDEFVRIFSKYGDISKVIIKTNEFAGSDMKTKRCTSYQEAILMLYCGQKDVPVLVKVYKGLKTNSKNVQNDIERLVGRTDIYWDKKMADAVMAAYWGINN